MTPATSAAMMPTTLAKLRYDSTTLPASSRTFAVSPDGMPLMK